LDYQPIEMELEVVLVIAAETSSTPIALSTFSPPVLQMELTVSGIMNGSEQTADLELAHDGKVLDLDDIAGVRRDHAVPSGMLKGRGKETELVNVEPAPWMILEEASIATVVAEVEVEMAEIFDTASETYEGEMGRKGETDVICWLSQEMNLNGVVEELELELAVVAAAAVLDQEVLGGT
jgi:hypothetical protein